MLEGGRAREFTNAKALVYSEPPLFARLFENSLPQSSSEG